MNNDVLMDGEIMRVVKLILCLSILILSCDDNSTSSGSHFRVRIIDEHHLPVAGATLNGGFDWDEFRVTTGFDGYAEIPEYGLHVYTTFYKDNFYSSYTSSLEPREYTISHCPYQFVEIGNIEGTAIRFTDNRIVTATYQGIYHLYEYSDAGINELSSVQIPLPFKDFELYGDTLWYTTHDDGVYVYLIDDLYNPRQIAHLNVTGYLWPMARKDSLLAIGDIYSIGPLRIFDVSLDGTINLMDEISSFRVDQMAFKGNYLATIGNYQGLPNIFDINNPQDISLVYSGAIENFRRGFFSGDSIILISELIDNLEHTYEHIALKLNDPENPQISARFEVPGTLEAILDDTLAVGHYNVDSKAITIFRRNQALYEVLGMISEGSGIEEYKGAKPPYYLINNKLYKLSTWN